MKTGLSIPFTCATVVSVIALFVALGGSFGAASRASRQQTIDDIRAQALRAGQVASADVLNRSIASTDLPALFNVNYCSGPALVTRAQTAFPGSAVTPLHNLRASSSLPTC
jgi:hypothetical protein